MPNSFDGNLTASQGYRPARSKKGCQTCKRRKVRCNEQRPRCNHCERLNLQCTWRPVTRNASSNASAAPPPSTSLTAGMFEPADNAFDSWDFNEMIWQDTSRLDFNSLEWLTSDTPLNGQTMSAMAAPLATTVASTTAMGDMSQQYTPQSQSSLALRNCHPSDTASPASSVDLDGHALVEHFLASWHRSR